MAHRVVPPYLSVNDNQLLITQYDVEMYEQLLSFVTNLNDSRPAQTIKRHHKDLVQWIMQMTPKLIDSASFSYDIQTRCRWILSGRNEFPICRFCKKPFGMNRNMPIRYDYSEWCSNRCRQTDPIVVGRVKATKFKNHGDENYCNVEKITQTFMNHYGVSNPNKCKDVREKLEQTCLERYGSKCVFSSEQIKEKIVQTNLERYGAKSTLTNPLVRKKGMLTLLDKYGVDHPSKSPIIRQKIKKTFAKHYGTNNNMKSKDGFKHWQQCFKAKYGVDNPLKCPEIKEKTRRKYYYENIWFDSAPELAYYIWLKDHNMRFEYQPKTPLMYESNGIQHTYFPDFKVNDTYVEIKGDQFFDESGKMICPYRDKNMSDDEYNAICEQFEAKHQCMLKNNVIILKYENYKFFLDYVKQKYGKDYLKRFRVKRKREQQSSVGLTNSSLS